MKLIKVNESNETIHWNPFKKQTHTKKKTVNRQLWGRSAGKATERVQCKFWKIIKSAYQETLLLKMRTAPVFLSIHYNLCCIVSFPSSGKPVSYAPPPTTRTPKIIKSIKYFIFMTWTKMKGFVVTTIQRANIKESRLNILFFFFFLNKRLWAAKCFPHPVKVHAP